MLNTQLASKRTLSLAAVCIQSTVLAIVIHVSQSRTGQGPSYKASSAVFLTEVGKLLLSSALALKDTSKSIKQHRAELSAGDLEEQLHHTDLSSDTSHSSGSRTSQDSELQLLPSCKQAQRSIFAEYFAQVLCPRWWHMGLPALLFLVQNNLIYVAARNLSVPVFQITFQLKTLITALCAVLMLGRKLDATQWLSLFFLGIGVGTIQLSPGSSSSSADAQADLSAWSHSFSRDQIIGLVSVILSCFCSAIAATYFEAVVKKNDPPAPSKTVRSHRTWPSLAGSTDESTANELATVPAPIRPTKISLWVRNVQLSFFSCLLGLFVVAGETLSRDGASFNNWVASLGDGVTLATFSDPVHLIFGSFLEGFDALTWIVIVIQAIGGLLTALVIKHADNVAKGFALSASVVLTVITCILFFDYQLTLPVVVGTATVLFATYAFENGLRGLTSRLSSWTRPSQVNDLESETALLEKA